MHVHVIVIALALTLLSACTEPPAPTPATRSSSRIISLAPSITETLFALGAGDRVVGVTRYCDHPPAARALPKVGGYYDPNYEAILSLRPDLVIRLPEHAAAARYLSRLDVEVLEVEHRTVEGVLSSIQTVARRLGVEGRGRILEQQIRGELERIAARVAGRLRPRVMISIGRTYGTGTIREVYIAGRDDYYERLVELAGGRLAFESEGARFPKISVEGLLRIDPEVVIEIAPDLARKGTTREQILAEWRTLTELRAAREGRIHVLSGDHTSIPGPRLPLVLLDLARVLHPELDWSTP